jgi:hypothetical protein
MYSCALCEQGTESEPDGRVVIAARDHDVDGGAGKRRQRFVQQAHRVRRRDGSVIHIAGHEYGVDLALDGQLDQPVQESTLVLEHRLSVQGAAEMPVGRVQQLHRPQYETPRRQFPGGASV